MANSVLSKGKSAIHPLFYATEVLSFACDKTKFFAENFSKNSNLADSGISLPAFLSRTCVKLQNIPLTSKFVKKVITNLDSSKRCCVVLILFQW